jgi:hypothetical protein
MPVAIQAGLAVLAVVGIVGLFTWFSGWLEEKSFNTAIVKTRKELEKTGDKKAVEMFDAAVADFKEKNRGYTP